MGFFKRDIRVRVETKGFFPYLATVVDLCKFVTCTRAFFFWPYLGTSIRAVPGTHSTLLVKSGECVALTLSLSFVLIKA